MAREFGAATRVSIGRLAITFHDMPNPDTGEKYESENDNDDDADCHVAIVAR